MEILRGLYKTFSGQSGQQKVSNVEAVIGVVFVDVIKKVRQPFLDIDSG